MREWGGEGCRLGERYINYFPHVSSWGPLTCGPTIQVLYKALIFNLFIYFIVFHERNIEETEILNLNKLGPMSKPDSINY